MSKPIVPSILRGRLRLSEYTGLLLTAAAVGLLAGLGNVAYRKLLELAHLLLFEEWGNLLGVRSYFPSLLLLPLLPMTGALLLMPLDAWFPGEIRGPGLPRFLESVNLKGAIFRARSIVAHAAGSILTIASGGSAGMEYPIAQIGGVMGSVVGQRLRVGHERLRTLVGCGVAAGIAGTFNAPIAGVFFAEEIVLLRSFGASSFTPLVISSGIGALVARTVEGNHPAFYVPHYILRSPREILFYAGLGLLVAAVAVHFIRTFYAISDSFAAWRIPPRLKPLAGAALTGTVALFLPQVMGNGYEHVEHALAGRFGGWVLPLPEAFLSDDARAALLGPLAGWVLLALALAKIYATGFTLGSGNAGGVFAPSLFIGAMLGGAYGILVNAYFPEIASSPGTYAVVGMGGFLAAAAHAPMTAIFLIFEMTSEYSIILPLMFTSVIGYTVSRHFQRESIETLELARRGIHLEEGREVSVLESIRVADIMNPRVEVIPEAMPLRGILRFIPSSRHVTFPVVDPAGKLSGILSLQDFREMAYEEGLQDLVVAKEMATPDVVTVYPDESLRDALSKIGFRNIEHLPVVSRQDPREILGMLSRRDVVAAYNKALVEHSLRVRES
ncbi:MAG: chloride channel protein [Deltaproteobacteria bacterium]|nr:chloride channel protein [Deltaproteobacteria bacterium]